jgi:AcrR family transcriptional regulator
VLLPAQLESQYDQPTHTVIAIAPRRLQRRSRIIAAARALATRGHAAVQIRHVAACAGVSASTVYRYFASKDDLLVACLHQWLLEISSRHGDLGLLTGPIERVLVVVEKTTRELCAQPVLADAAVRAYLYANGDAAENAALCRNTLASIFINALGATRDEHSGMLVDLIADMWATNVPAIIQQRSSVGDLLERLERAMVAINLG